MQPSPRKTKVKLWRAGLYGALFSLGLWAVNTAVATAPAPSQAYAAGVFLGFQLFGVILFVGVAFINNIRVAHSGPLQTVPPAGSSSIPLSGPPSRAVALKQTVGVVKILLAVVSFGLGVAFVMVAVNALVHPGYLADSMDMAIPAMLGAMFLLGAFLLLRRSA